MAIIYNPNLIASPLESGALPGLKPEAPRPFSDLSSGSPTGAAESEFEKALKDMVHRVNETQNSADASVARLAAGQEPNIHHTMLELEQAEIAMKLAMQVRSKVIDAYHEIMRMQL